ncbi:ADP-ribosylation factor-binding protein GGA1 isoform X2 [Sitophilus oryzae]|uniref:ADP-ribosylation factor-binding protein GGA1 isoform X2 n=1 Tax=Sitophilus oryzae TaxID=7048 RepID=A0A6J2XWJ4_SITOR|nr:ADP-ribosylation factor-binding protein GGA1 isoform X2 [Sitophilus oryzae]
MTNLTQISLEALLLRATNCNKTNLDSVAVEAFITLINKERDGPTLGVKVIASRLPVDNEKEVLSTLNILDMCMSKCGSVFQDEVGKFRFLNEMIKLVSPKYLGSKTPLTVKQKILQLLYLWTLDYPKEVKIKEAFDMLRKQGVIKEIPNPNIPQEAIGFETRKKIGNSVFQDEEKSNILRKLLQSKDPEDIQAANWLIKSMVKEDEKLADLKSKAVSELESVQNNLKLLNEMMGSYNKGVTTKGELDLMDELYNNLLRLSPNLKTIACETDHCPADLMESVLKTIHDLTECLTRYKLQILHEKSSSLKQSNLSSLLELDQQAINVSSLSLIEMDQPKEIRNEGCSCSNQLNKANKKNSVDALYDVFAGLGSIPQTTNILQPVAIPSCKEKCSLEREKENKLKALEDLDVLEEHLLKENLPSSNYRHQDKIPMNLLTKINENHNLNEETSESLKLNLNCLIDTPTFSQRNMSNDETLSLADNVDDCLVDITEDFSEGSERGDNIKSSKKEQNELSVDNGDMQSSVTQKTNVENGADNANLNGQSNDSSKNHCDSVAKSNCPELAVNLKEIFVKLEDIKPSSKKSIVALDEKNGITVLLHMAKDKPRPGVIVYVITTISRNEVALTNYMFQAVVPKKCKLKLQSPSSTDLPPFNAFLPPAAITQIMLIANPELVRVSLKFVVSYVIDDDTVTEMGEIEDLPTGE